MINKIIGLSIIGITLISVTFGVAYQNMVVGDGASEVAANIPYATDSSKTFSEHYNLVANSDLLLDSNSDNIPDGFEHRNYTSLSLINGVLTWTSTAQYSRIRLSNYSMFSAGKYYIFSSFATDSSLVSVGAYFPLASAHSGSGLFEHCSFVYEITSADLLNPAFLGVYDNRSSDWTPISVDYIGAIDITDLVSRGILPSGLTDAEYKTILDDKVQDGSPYFNFNLEYDFSTSGSGFYSAVSDFLSWLGTIGDVVNNVWLEFSEFITQVYPGESTNFILAFGDDRFLELGGFTDEVPFWTNWRSKWDQADYDVLYSHLTDLEKIWLGSLTPQTHQSLPYHTAYFSYTEKLLLGLTPKAISETYSLWEKCVSYVATL